MEVVHDLLHRGVKTPPCGHCEFTGHYMVRVVLAVYVEDVNVSRSEVVEARFDRQAK